MNFPQTRFCILQAIKNWRWEWPGNEANLITGAWYRSQVDYDQSHTCTCLWGVICVKFHRHNLPPCRHRVPTWGHNMRAQPEGHNMRAQHACTTLKLCSYAARTSSAVVERINTCTKSSLLPPLFWPVNFSRCIWHIISKGGSRWFRINCGWLLSTLYDKTVVFFFASGGL